MSPNRAVISLWERDRERERERDQAVLNIEDEPVCWINIGRPIYINPRGHPMDVLDLTGASAKIYSCM
jgi:hypothetical protein